MMENIVKTKFSNEEEYINYLVELVSKDIIELTQNRSNDFTFKVEDMWYQISSEYLIKTPWAKGASLVFKAGYDREHIKGVYTKQIDKDFKYELIFKKLRDFNKEYNLFEIKKSSVVSGLLAEIFRELIDIKKLSEYFFNIKTDDKEYFISKKEAIKNREYHCVLNFTILNDEVEERKFCIEGVEDVNCILSYLNFVYYANKVRDTEKFNEIQL